MANLKETYAKSIVPALKEKLGVTNPMLVPRLTKIVVNMGFGIVEKDVQKQKGSNVGAIGKIKPVLMAYRSLLEPDSFERLTEITIMW